MRLLALLLISAISLASSSAFAASYQRTDGSVIDPIQTVFGGFNHIYSGNNLEPFANLDSAFLDGANLTRANLFNANLTNANLTNANLGRTNLTGAILSHANLGSANLFNADLTNAALILAYLGSANLTSANLSGADLSYTYLSGADLTNADLTGAILANATGLGNSFGAAFYNINTDFTGTGFDPVAAGWTLVPVPEPGTALLMGLGLAGLAARRR